MPTNHFDDGKGPVLQVQRFDVHQIIVHHRVNSQIYVTLASTM